MSDDTSAARPSLQVIRGDATSEEVAVIMAVLSAVGSAPDEAPTSGRSAWNDPARLLGQPGAGGWRSSALPR